MCAVRALARSENINRCNPPIDVLRFVAERRIATHRLANWRWSRLLAQMLNRITNLQHCTKVQ
ncbi:hypothetical protein [Empedobacter falsenii]|uniref:hypothetical protein n=1 Tax=Empedobacter falsenii TaxID=343874 RepID=UPI001C57B68E|nr:hypothetical protein [Empedobacter falsenii]MBW1619464.1 hypothetical protein [Empedobacter falsenii]